MRISDWSSDVCSSDLIVAERHNGIVVATQGDLRAVRLIGGHRQPHGGIDHRARGCLEPQALLGIGVELAEMGGSNAELGRPVLVRGAVVAQMQDRLGCDAEDRQSVVYGKRVSGSGSIGGGRNSKKKK